MHIKTDFDMFMKPLNDEIALEKGIEFFYEIIFYCIIIAICTYEITINYYKGVKKKAEDKASLKRLEELLIMKEGKIVDLEKKYTEKFKGLKTDILAINLKMEKIAKHADSNLAQDKELQIMLGRLNEKFTVVEQVTNQMLLKNIELRELDKELH